MSVRRKLARLSELTWRERSWLAQGWVLVLAADLALRTMPFERVLRVFGGPGSEAGGSASASRRLLAERVRELVAVAARHHLWTMACLRQVLAASPLLRRQGVATVVRVGVQRDGAGLRAHAWLELDGEPVGEDDLQEFQLLEARR